MNQPTPNFHGEDVTPSRPEEALFHVIPVPYEESVSYGTGTGAGPEAVLAASCQLELLTLEVVPAQYGLYTAPAVDCSGTCETVLQNITDAVEATLALNKVPILIGGEHTVTCGAITALRNRFDHFGVIQFDAHADLRHSYAGSPFSHACVMRRIHEQQIPIYQLGTRSYSMEERDYRHKQRIAFRDAEDIWRNGHQLQLPEDFPEKVFVTFDIDGLDSAVLPATGTPVPGGLSWYQAMWLLEQIMENRVCIGFDMVEFAPIPLLHGNAFTAAQLVYNMMGYLVKSETNRRFHRLT